MATSMVSSSTTVELDLPEGGPPLNDYFSMQVWVSGPSPSGISVDADMPSHGHGMVSKPILQYLGDGAWHVDGMMLHMPGYWEIYVDVERDGLTDRTIFPINLEPFSG